MVLPGPNGNLPTNNMHKTTNTGSNAKKTKGSNTKKTTNPKKTGTTPSDPGAKFSLWTQPDFAARISGFGNPFGSGVEIQRGHMAWDPTVQWPPPYSTGTSTAAQTWAKAPKVFFLYNPSVVAVSYPVADGSIAASIIYPASNPTPSLRVPLQQQVSFTIMFDRTYEVTSRGRSGSDVGQIGVDVDILAMKQYTGQFATVYGTANSTGGTASGGAGGSNNPFNDPKSTSSSASSQQSNVNTAFSLGGINQGVSQITLGYVYFGAPSSGLRYYGYVDSWDVQYCLDEETEILTRRGWLKHYELTTDDECLGIDPNTKAIRWQPVESVHRFDHDGDLVHWKNSHGFDALGTWNHRWLMESGEFERTYQISGTQKNIQTGGGIPQCFPSHPLHTDEFVELIGWVITEGTYPKDSTLGVRIGQSERKNPEKTERIRALAKYFADHGATTSEYSSVGAQVFYFGKGIGGLLRQIAPGKQLTPEFLSSLTLHQAHLLYEILMDGDGHRGSTHRFTQKDQGRIDGFQMLCAMLGKRTCAKKHKGISVSDVSVYSRTVTNAESLRESPEHYKGIVWCPKTSTQTWLARSRGGTFWTGNTHFAWDMIPVRAVVDISFSLLPTPAQNTSGGPPGAAATAASRIVGMSGTTFHAVTGQAP